MGRMFGYVRVSTRDQNEDRQMILMREFHIPERRIFIDKQSGKDFDRPEYKRLMRQLREDDVICIKSIDRLGRNYNEVLEQWKTITRDKKADIFVIDMPLLDTRRDKDLLGTFISDLVLTLLSYICESERLLIHQRQAEGIAAAKRRGVRFGRKPIPLPENFFDIYHLWKEKKLTTTQAAQQCQMARTTFHDRAKSIEEIT